MADRVTINPSTEPGGADVLTDTITSLNGSAITAAEAQRAKVGFGGDGTYQDVSAGTPMPVTDAGQATVHTDLQALLAQLVAILAKQPADPSTGAKQDTLIAKDYATQTTLAAVLAKITADPATQTTLAAVLTKLTTSASSTLAVRLSDGSAYLNLATVSDRLKVDVGGSLPAGSNAIGSVSVSNLPPDPPTAANQAIPADRVGTLTDDRKTVAIPGAAVAIVSSSTPCKWVTVTALLTNTLQVNVGGSAVSSVTGSTKGTPLLPGAAMTIPVDNANKVFVDATVATEGVSFTVGS
jgi:hypothetical protein